VVGICRKATNHCILCRGFDLRNDSAALPRGVVVGERAVSKLGSPDVRNSHGLKQTKQQTNRRAWGSSAFLEVAHARKMSSN
jgi:hypothetical protein